MNVKAETQTMPTSGMNQPFKYLPGVVWTLHKKACSQTPPIPQESSNICSGFCVLVCIHSSLEDIKCRTPTATTKQPPSTEASCKVVAPFSLPVLFHMSGPWNDSLGAQLYLPIRSDEANNETQGYVKHPVDQGHKR
eukprot:3179087-Amphidinium_carterae.1